MQKIDFQFSAVHFKKLWIVGERLLQNLFFSNNWNIVWLVLLISLLNVHKIRHITEAKLLALISLLSFGMYYFGYTFTQHYYWAAETDTVISRGILPIYPLATMLIIFLNFANAPHSSPENTESKT